jgi:hypothetical protein
MAADDGFTRPVPPLLPPLLPPLQMDQVYDPVMIGGLHIETARLARGGRGPKLYVAATKGSDLHAGRGGFGLSRDEAIMDLFRYLRFLGAARPLQ